MDTSNESVLSNLDGNIYKKVYSIGFPYIIYPPDSRVFGEIDPEYISFYNLLIKTIKYSIVGPGKKNENENSQSTGEPSSSRRRVDVESSSSDESEEEEEQQQQQEEESNRTNSEDDETGVLVFQTTTRNLGDLSINEPSEQTIETNDPTDTVELGIEQPQEPTVVTTTGASVSEPLGSSSDESDSSSSSDDEIGGEDVRTESSRGNQGDGEPQELKIIVERFKNQNTSVGDGYILHICYLTDRNDFSSGLTKIFSKTKWNYDERSRSCFVPSKTNSGKVSNNDNTKTETEQLISKKRKKRDIQDTYLQYDSVNVLKSIFSSYFSLFPEDLRKEANEKISNFSDPFSFRYLDKLFSIENSYKMMKQYDYNLNVEYERDEMLLSIPREEFSNFFDLFFYHADEEEICFIEKVYFNHKLNRTDQENQLFNLKLKSNKFMANIENWREKLATYSHDPSKIYIREIMEVIDRIRKRDERKMLDVCKTDVDELTRKEREFIIDFHLESQKIFKYIFSKNMASPIKKLHGPSTLALLDWVYLNKTTVEGKIVFFGGSKLQNMKQSDVFSLERIETVTPSLHRKKNLDILSNYLIDLSVTLKSDRLSGSKFFTFIMLWIKKNSQYSTKMNLKSAFFLVGPSASGKSREIDLLSMVSIPDTWRASSDSGSKMSHVSTYFNGLKVIYYDDMSNLFTSRGSKQDETFLEKFKTLISSGTFSRDVLEYTVDKDGNKIRVGINYIVSHKNVYIWFTNYDITDDAIVSRSTIVYVPKPLNENHIDNQILNNLLSGLSRYTDTKQNYRDEAMKDISALAGFYRYCENISAIPDIDRYVSQMVFIMLKNEYSRRGQLINYDTRIREKYDIMFKELSIIKSILDVYDKDNTGDPDNRYGKEFSMEHVYCMRRKNISTIQLAITSFFLTYPLNINFMIKIFLEHIFSSFGGLVGINKIFNTWYYTYFSRYNPRTGGGDILLNYNAQLLILGEHFYMQYGESTKHRPKNNFDVRFREVIGTDNMPYIDLNYIQITYDDKMLTDSIYSRTKLDKTKFVGFWNKIKELSSMTLKPEVVYGYLPKSKFKEYTGLTNKLFARRRGVNGETFIEKNNEHGTIDDIHQFLIDEDRFQSAEEDMNRVKLDTTVVNGLISRPQRFCAYRHEEYNPNVGIPTVIIESNEKRSSTISISLEAYRYLVRNSTNLNEDCVKNAVKYFITEPTDFYVPKLERDEYCIVSVIPESRDHFSLFSSGEIKPNYIGTGFGDDILKHYSSLRWVENENGLFEAKVTKDISKNIDEYFMKIDKQKLFFYTNEKLFEQENLSDDDELDGELFD